MRLLITGVSGYAGMITLPLLFADQDVERIIGLDVKPPALEHEKLSFVEGDVRDPGIAEHFADVDTVLHLAFVVTEIKDKSAIHSINVDGSKTVLEAVAKSKITQLVVASSVAAYGSHPDNPDPITETSPLRGNSNSYYSHTKVLVEQMLDAFEMDHEGVTVTRLRPSVFCGRNTNNFFLDFLRVRFLAYPRENREGIPVVHEDDVARAFHLALKQKTAGAFNITAGNLGIDEMAKVLGIPALGAPYPVLKQLLNVGYSLGVSPCSAHWLELGRYPLRLSNDKAREVLGWQPEHAPLEAFKEMVDTRRKSDRG